MSPQPTPPYPRVDIIRVKKLWPNWVMARSNNRKMFWREDAAITRKAVAHELAHVWQRIVLGWRFLPVYLGWIIRLAPRARFNMRKIHELHPMEIEARVAETDPAFLNWADETIYLNL